MEENKEVIEEVKDNKEIEELKAEIRNLKTTLSEKNSENAKRKREALEWQEKYNATLSEAEKAEQQRQKEEEERQTLLNELIRKNDIAENKAEFLAMGYSDELATKSATAFVDGDKASLMDGMKSFLDAKQKEFEANLLKQQPGLSSGKPLSSKDVEDAEMKKLRRYAGLE